MKALSEPALGKFHLQRTGRTALERRKARCLLALRSQVRPPPAVRLKRPTRPLCHRRIARVAFCKPPAPLGAKAPSFPFPFPFTFPFPFLPFPFLSLSLPFHFLSFCFLSFAFLSILFTFLSFPFLSFPFLAFPFLSLSFPFLSFPLLSSPLFSFPFHFLCFPFLSFPGRKGQRQIAKKGGAKGAAQKRRKRLRAPGLEREIMRQNCGKRKVTERERQPVLADPKP